jgi:hypothetical protein
MDKTLKKLKILCPHLSTFSLSPPTLPATSHPLHHTTLMHNAELNNNAEVTNGTQTRTTLDHLTTEPQADTLTTRPQLAAVQTNFGSSSSLNISGFATSIPEITTHAH